MARKNKNSCSNDKRNNSLGKLNFGYTDFKRSDDEDLLMEIDDAYPEITCLSKAYARAQKFYHKKRLLRNAKIASLSMRKRKRNDRDNNKRRLYRKDLKFSYVKRAKALLKKAAKMQKQK